MNETDFSWIDLEVKIHKFHGSKRSDYYIAYCAVIFNNRCNCKEALKYIEKFR